MCNEDGPSLPMDKQLCRTFQSRLLHMFSLLCPVWMHTFSDCLDSHSLPCSVQSTCFDHNTDYFVVINSLMCTVARVNSVNI